MSRKVDPSGPLQRVLDDYGLTQEDFARANDMGIATANRWANGKVMVPERRLAKALAEVGADPADYGVKDPRVQTPGASEPAPVWAVSLDRKLDEVLTILKHMENAR